MKHEWRKKEKSLYLPKTKPERITIPPLQFLTIRGEGNPKQPEFANCIGALYSVSYAIKMTLKKQSIQNDYTVYPLEGIWDINEKAKANFNGTINKDDFVYQLMIRQPSSISNDFVQEMMKLSQSKKPELPIQQLKFETITDGTCIQMLHIGSFDTEKSSFDQMEQFASDNKMRRIGKTHREIYLSDFRKTPEEKRKTTLRFWVQ